jgi:hypothetical protein
MRERRHQLHNMRPITWILRHDQDSSRLAVGRLQLTKQSRATVCHTLSSPVGSTVDVHTRRYNLRGWVLKPEEAAAKKADV